MSLNLNYVVFDSLTSTVNSTSVKINYKFIIFIYLMNHLSKRLKLKCYHKLSQQYGHVFCALLYQNIILSALFAVFDITEENLCHLLILEDIVCDHFSIILRYRPAHFILPCFEFLNVRGVWGPRDTSFK